MVRLAKNKSITFCSGILPVLVLTGCGDSLSFDERLAIAMYGVFEAPDGASGNAEPYFQNYTLQDVALTNADGTAVDAYEVDPVILRIINRSQIIHEINLKNFQGQSFTDITVTFAPEISGQSEGKQSLTATLSESVLTHSEAFTINDTTSRRLKIEVLWRDTVTQDPGATPSETMSAPGFKLELVKE